MAEVEAEEMPEDYAGVIMGDLEFASCDASRAWSIARVWQKIKAIVPLAEMFGYATHMRSEHSRGAPSTDCTSRATKQVPRSVSEARLAGRSQGPKR